MKRQYIEETHINLCYTDKDLDLLYDEAEPIEPKTRETEVNTELKEDIIE